MKNWSKLLILVIICVIVVGAVYVWKLGLPAFLSREERYMSSLYSKLVIDDEKITAALEGKSIIFTKKIVQTKDGEETEETMTIEFSASNGIVNAVVPSSVEDSFVNSAVKYVFLAATNLNEQDEINAIYSLIPDVIANKTLSDDGYSFVSQNGVTRFSMKINQKFNLANGQDVYIKVADVENVIDIIKYKLQNKIIEKPGIVLEKAVSYSDKLVYIIYEKEKLTDRAYNSFLSLITEVLENKLEYVKANYPSITRAGTLTLDGITISLNEKINENNIHTYNMPEGYEYMVVRININEVEK